MTPNEKHLEKVLSERKLVGVNSFVILVAIGSF
jgi:hypothetical protein